MAGTKLTLLDDPRYPEFVERYYADALRFAVEVCGMLPSADQIELLTEISAPTARVSVVSGTTTGKTAAFGRIVLWSLLAQPYAHYEDKIEIGSNTYVGAARLDQVADGVWKEASDADLAIASGPFAWLRDYYVIMKERMYVRGFESQWFVSQIALQKGQSVGVAGKHRFHQLIIIDEAAGVSDEHFEVINGTQTQPFNRTLLASQGVKPAGFFYESHHRLATKNGGNWVALRFDSENSPFVTDESLAAKALEAGGRDSVEYQVRVKGLFAQNSNDFLLTRQELERIIKDEAIIGPDEPFGLLLTVDVGLGEYRDESVAVVSKVCGSSDMGDDARRVEFIQLPLCTNSRNEIDFTGDLADVFDKLREGGQPVMYVDSGGIGAAVCRLLEKQGVPVERVNWGKPCFAKAYKERFFNQRACAQVRFRDAVKQGRVRIRFPMDSRLREKILDQGARLPYEFVEAGGLRYKIMSKEDMRALGIKSPDLIDAMSFTFLEDAHYIEQSPDQSGAGSIVSSRAEEMASALDAALGI